MKKSYLALILLLIAMALGVGGFFVYNNYFSKEAKEETAATEVLAETPETKEKED